MGSKGVRLFSCFRLSLAYFFHYGVNFSLSSFFLTCPSVLAAFQRRWELPKGAVTPEGVWMVSELASPGQEGGTAEFSGARVSLGAPKSSMNSSHHAWGSPSSVSCKTEQLLGFC